MRNARAHGDLFTRLDAWRAHDYCIRLLEYFGDAQGLVKANALRQEALLAYIDEQGIAPVPVAASTAPSVEPGLASEPVAQLIAASFGVQKLHVNRAAKITRQAKAAGLLIDKAKFVWPDGVDPKAWTEFRPNTSQVERPFLFVSPVEIANAMRFLKQRAPGISDTDLDSETLRTFGRKRRTKQFAAHLAKTKALV